MRVGIAVLLLGGTVGVAYLLSLGAVFYAGFAGTVALSGVLLFLGERRDYRYSLAGFTLVGLASAVLAVEHAVQDGIDGFVFALVAAALVSGWRAGQYYRATR